MFTRFQTYPSLSISAKNSNYRHHPNVTLTKTVLLDGRPQIILALGGVNVDALVDTGASRTLMDMDLFKQVCHAQRRPNILPKSRKLISVTGQGLNVQGK